MLKQTNKQIKHQQPGAPQFIRGQQRPGPPHQLVIHPTGRFSSLLLYDHKEEQLSKKDSLQMALEAEGLGAGGGDSGARITGPRRGQDILAFSAHVLSPLPAAGPATTPQPEATQLRGN